MSNQDNKKELNPLEKQLEEISEWQKNATNPGHFVGTGKVPIALKNFYRTPIVMLIVGAIFLIFAICNLISNFSIETIPTSIIIMIVSSVLIIRAIIRLSKKT
ncbi:hypothetical protein [Clostridium sp. ZS2-4]|uniref:hypothetical protein n=1 Tax=Clostridium sp. ZS2-4 TaxID=2987703 RepID=UPI00227C7777|nr:hypothetical protein [Clostridium sp. ZS2-4]MCY6355306.1 hypothetical protein [Clostridium sp. ZS2-4]